MKYQEIDCHDYDDEYNIDYIEYQEIIYRSKNECPETLGPNESLLLSAVNNFKEKYFSTAAFFSIFV